MLISYKCPECEHSGHAEVFYEDQQFKCPECNEALNLEDLKLLNRTKELGKGTNIPDEAIVID